METSFLIETTTRLLGGIPMLLQLWAISVASGAVLAIVIAMLNLSGVKPLEWLARSYVFVFRGTPLLVQMFLIYYGLSQFPEVRQSFLWIFLRQPYWCAILAFVLNTAAYGSEIVRGGLLAVPFGQVEAARACGMSGLLLFRRIVFPIAIRQALPAYGNEIILMVKATSLASIITLMEVTGIASRIISETYRAVEVFICAGAIYLAINFIISRGVAWLEHRLSAHVRSASPTRPAVVLSADRV
jgi:octopine/nopaline transport system permease protein